MNNTLKGKRILFFDGSHIMCGPIRRAKELGMTVFVVNYYPKEVCPGKQLADYSAEIDFSNIDAVVRYIKDNRIDGIFVAFADSHLPFYEEICAKAGLPCYMNKKQILCSTDKQAFTEMCGRNNVPTTPKFNLTKDLRREDLDKIEYPVVVKPVDSSGSRGVYICRTERELIDAAKTSLEYSKRKEIIVERYFDSEKCDDIYLNYYLSNGEISMSAMCDAEMYIHHNGLVPVQNILIYPSKYVDEYMASLDGKVKAMLKNEGFENGYCFFQGFAENGNFYFYEMGFRIGGAEPYYHTVKQSGNDWLKAMFNFAVNGNMGNPNMQLENPRFGFKACTLVIVLKPGTIHKIIGLEDILKIDGVFRVQQLLYEGEEVGLQGTSGSMFCRVFITGQNDSEIKNAIAGVMDKIEVLDIDNKSLILEGKNVKN